MAGKQAHRASGGAGRRSPAPALADTPGAQFARFVLAGTTANLAYAAVFLGLAFLGEQSANAAGALVSAGVANELHRRLTFRARSRVGWRTAQWQGGLTLAAGLAASSSALAWLDSVPAGTGPLIPLVVAAAVNGFIGLVRFVTLRWLFTRRSPGWPARPPRPPVAVPADRTLAALAA